MKYPRIRTPLYPTGLAVNVAVEEIDLGNGIYCRVSLTRSALDPRLVAEGGGTVETTQVVVKKAQQIDAQGNLVARPDGLASGTRTTSETVDTTEIGDTKTWRPGWVRVPPGAGATIAADSLPEGATALEALPETGEPGQQVYVEPTLYLWHEGLVAAMVDGKGDELLRVLRNSDQLANTAF